MERQYVSSSNIASIGYDPDNQVLEIEFLSGAVYQYYDVPQSVYDGLMASADEVIILSKYYYNRCFLDRDEFMVENASLLIAFYDGREKGGTYYTFKKANCLGVPVVNIY